MSRTTLKHSLATVIVAAGMLAAAATASADQSSPIRAELGASVYQHNQTDLEFLAMPTPPRPVGGEGVGVRGFVG